MQIKLIRQNSLICKLSLNSGKPQIASQNGVIVQEKWQVRSLQRYNE